MLERIKKLLENDKDPCKECLVIPCCDKVCITKSRWKKHPHSLIFPFFCVYVIFYIFGIIYLFGIAVILNHFGLVSIEKVTELNPFLEEEDHYY
jgi:hypothetical protein